jgi:hypothetical protein
MPTHIRIRDQSLVQMKPAEAFSDLVNLIAASVVAAPFGQKLWPK